MRKMRIKRPYYDAIMSGKKTLEVRVGYNSIKRLKAGELLQLETGHMSGVVRIKSIRIYRSFAGVEDESLEDYFMWFALAARRDI